MFPVYTPWRLSDADCEFSNRANEGVMDFTDEEIKEICEFIKERVCPESFISKNIIDVNSTGLIYE